MEVSHRLRRHGAPAPPLSLLLAAPTVAEVAAWLAAADEDQAEAGDPSGAAVGAALPPAPMPTGSSHPLADGQRALLLAERMGDGGRQTVLTCAARLGRRDGAPLTAARVEAALLALSRRHPALRLAFPVTGDEAVQRVAPPELDFAAHDASGWEEGKLRDAVDSAAAAPFDLAAGPPWRARW